MKKTILSFAFVVMAAACGGKSKPPTEPINGGPDVGGQPTGTPTTAEECEAAGFQVVGDIGDGQVKCPDGTEEVSRIKYGIEGGVCCKAAADGAADASSQTGD